MRESAGRHIGICALDKKEHKSEHKIEVSKNEHIQNNKLIYVCIYSL